MTLTASRQNNLYKVAVGFINKKSTIIIYSGKIGFNNKKQMIIFEQGGGGIALF